MKRRMFFPFTSLYSRLLGWMLLNMFVIGGLGAAFFAYMTFGNNGLMPTYLFSSDIENLFRVISTNLQYHHTYEWGYIVENYNESEGLRFHLISLDEKGLYYTGDLLPDRVVEAAYRVPRIPFTLCPDPPQVFRESVEYQMADSGLASAPPAIFIRTEDGYWYGRALFVPDVESKAHYLLLTAQSGNFSGNGLFFNIRGAVLILAGIVVFSCIWWLPFIWHITKPLLRMVSFAEAAANGPELAGSLPEKDVGRRDEIGRLSRALMSMTRKLSRKMAGQSRFIQHIAHELNSPIGRCKLGLAVLDDRLQGDERRRVRRIMQELDSLCLLTEDVLDFLRAQSSPQPVECGNVALAPLLADLTTRWMDTAEIYVSIPADAVVWGDKNCIRRAVLNALRNAVVYAGKKGPVLIRAEKDEARGTTTLIVRDYGDGVPEKELDLLMEPFFRGEKAKLDHPGGSGLGLAIVRSSLEQCGAQVRCRNEESGGFSVSMVFQTGWRE